MNTKDIITSLTKLRDGIGDGTAFTALTEAIRRLGEPQDQTGLTYAEVRHNAALKAWETRRRRQAEAEEAALAEERSERARRAWKTRRQNGD